MQTEIIQLIKIKDTQVQTEDVVALECSYEICVNGHEIFNVTCTPTDLEEMVLGALFSRGWIICADQVKTLELGTPISVTLKKEEIHCEHGKKEVMLTHGQAIDITRQIFQEPGELFRKTGCAHSCTLVRDGVILRTFEDIGRHNALDKVIGYGLKHHIPLESCAVFSSGRISGDYLGKIIHAGIPAVVSRAAVTSEAVRLAKEHKIRLYGFVRGNTANLYQE